MPHHPPLPQVLAAQRDDGLHVAPDAEILGALTTMVSHPEYPCLGAKSVFRREGAQIVVLDDMTDATPGGSLARLGAELTAYGRSVDAQGDFASFIACFRGPLPATELDFERALWGVLQFLHDNDDAPWAAQVSDDPSKVHFSFSHDGIAYFIVGLHPLASRVARRTPLPTMVFNLHAQFERLRDGGGYERMRDTIRRRDAALQGSVNPMVADHGASSEARQYAGRKVEADWAPPFETSAS